MSRKTLPPPGDAPPVKVRPLPEQPRKRRAGMAVITVALLAAGGAATFYTVRQLDQRSSVVVMVRDVPVGQQISADDLATTMVNTDQTVATVRGTELRNVVGRQASVDLMRGMLLMDRAVTERITPVSGQELVPIALKPSRLPARGLRPGDVVRVVPSEDSQAEAAAKTPRPTAVVDKVKAMDTDGLVVVDLLVNDADADVVASQASRGQLVLVLRPKGV